MPTAHLLTENGAGHHITAANWPLRAPRWSLLFADGHYERPQPCRRDDSRDHGDNLFQVGFPLQMLPNHGCIHFSSPKRRFSGADFKMKLKESHL